MTSEHENLAELVRQQTIKGIVRQASAQETNPAFRRAIEAYDQARIQPLIDIKWIETTPVTPLRTLDLIQ